MFVYAGPWPRGLVLRSLVPGPGCPFGSLVPARSLSLALGLGPGPGLSSLLVPLLWFGAGCAVRMLRVNRLPAS